MRMIVKGLAVISLMVASPALALTQGQLDCPAKTAPASLGAGLINAVMSDKTKDTEIDALFAQIDKVATDCAAATGLPSSKVEAYVTFVMDILVRDELLRRLTSAGVPIDALNAALGYGPGFPTRAVGELTDAKVAEVDRALSAKGYSLATAPDEVFGLIGIYTGAQDGLVEDIAKLD